MNKCRQCFTDVPYDLFHCTVCAQDVCFTCYDGDNDKCIGCPTPVICNWCERRATKQITCTMCIEKNKPNATHQTCDVHYVYCFKCASDHHCWDCGSHDTCKRCRKTCKRGRACATCNAVYCMESCAIIMTHVWDDYYICHDHGTQCCAKGYHVIGTPCMVCNNLWACSSLMWGDTGLGTCDWHAERCSICEQKAPVLRKGNLCSFPCYEGTQYFIKLCLLRWNVPKDIIRYILAMLKNS